MLAVSVYFLQSYGAALFVGTPLVMGVVASYLFNRTLPRSYPVSMLLGLGAVMTACMALLLFALEGVICVAMATPLLLPLGVLGGLMGKAIADSSRQPRGELLAILVLLPLFLGVEWRLNRPTEYVVMTAVEIDAPPEVVWEHVIAFPELAPPTEWHFQLGIACPQRARIVGSGVGATRYCEFTTGRFVEPITAWEEGRRLAFDVTEQPAPMFELTPYRDVHPPHLDGYLRSNRGEFLLVALPGGRTRLEGRTWYEMDLFPQAYWSLWSRQGNRMLIL
jgi:polyketide cyclase/dehydrase/lipid transport protein